MHWSLSTSSSDSNSINNIAVFSFVSELSSFVRSSWMVDSGDDRELSVLPGSNSHKESKNVALFLSPKFFQILVDTHVWL